MTSPEKKGVVITHESEVAYILGKYNTNFIYSTTIHALQNRIRYYDIKSPNIVSSLEDNFKIDSEQYNNLEDFSQTRERTYQDIVRIICDFYNISYNDTTLSNPDIYTSALLMYEFFISSFQNNISLFFINFIIKEKNGLYEMLLLSGKKKSKDTSTIYAKKTVKNQKMAIISANIELVIDSICSTFDITFDRYLESIYGSNTNSTKYLKSIITPRCDFFKNFIAVQFMNELNTTPFRSILLTDIKLKLQPIIANSEVTNIGNYIKEEE